MQLTPHFRLEEFQVSHNFPKLVRPVPVEYWPNALAVCVWLLEPIRSRFNVPIVIGSGFRDGALNKAVKGATQSDHLTCSGADAYAEGNAIAAPELFYAAMSLPTTLGALSYIGRVILYPVESVPFVHFGIPTPTQPTPHFMVAIGGRKYQTVTSPAETVAIIERLQAAKRKQRATAE